VHAKRARSAIVSGAVPEPFSLDGLTALTVKRTRDRRIRRSVTRERDDVHCAEAASRAKARLLLAMRHHRPLAQTNVNVHRRRRDSTMLAKAETISIDVMGM